MTQKDLPGGRIENQQEQTRPAGGESRQLNNRDHSCRDNSVSSREMLDPSKPGFAPPGSWEESAPALNLKATGYEIHDFTQYHDREFIQNAYLGILEREPDADGFNAYLKNLRQGVMTKSEILCQLRYSSEGRAKSVKVRGLFLVFLAWRSFKLPILGYFSRWVVGLIRLPATLRKLHYGEAQNHLQFFQFKDRQHQMEVSLQAMFEDMTQCHAALEELRAALAILQDRVARKVEIDSLEGLQTSKADRSDLDSLKWIQEAATTRVLGLLDDKADRTELESLAGIKVDRNELESLAAVKADRAQLESLAAIKADRTELESLAGIKVDRNELESLAAVKADRAQLESLAASKVDREELENVTALKANLEHVEAIRTQLVQYAGDIARLRLASVDQERKLWLFLEEAKKRLPEPFSPAELTHMIQEEDHLLDAFYVAFEDDFRGTREDIKQRLTYCLPYMEEAEAGGDAFPILDLGCGRGEWLELLKGKGLNSLGIDCNAIMVSLCREKGLEVIQADVLEFLRGQAPASFGAITGFHIIEHLPFACLIKVLDETRRVLKPGGVMLFETPNPKNILVGATTFCIDPTHKNPIHPSSMAFIAEYRGFSGVKIVYLNPPPAHCLIEGEDSVIVSKFNDYFYGPQDYAVVGHKS